ALGRDTRPLSKSQGPQGPQQAMVEPFPRQHKKGVSGGQREVCQPGEEYEAGQEDTASDDSDDLVTRTVTTTVLYEICVTVIARNSNTLHKRDDSPDHHSSGRRSREREKRWGGVSGGGDDAICTVTLTPNPNPNPNPTAYSALLAGIEGLRLGYGGEDAQGGASPNSGAVDIFSTARPAKHFRHNDKLQGPWPSDNPTALGVRNGVGRVYRRSTAPVF
ncbi:unnamed protein product, partial [Discosporangium mesarthrocarpum]